MTSQKRRARMGDAAASGHPVIIESLGKGDDEVTNNGFRQRSAMSTRSKLLSTAMVPAVIGVGMAFGGVMADAGPSANSAQQAKSGSVLPDAQPKTARTQLAFAAQCNPCAAKRRCNPCNPCAAKRGCNPCNPCAAKKRGCNPCNPCAAKRGCNPCKPCAAKRGCNPCNPCAAKNPCNPCSPCNPCNPCAGAAGAMTDCTVPRLQQASARCNPCAAKKRGCNPCNPCAAKKRGCNPCNPCAAKKRGCNPCNPCAAKKRGCNPCNPCAAKKRGCNPCNPCAAKNPCSPCNPCAAKNPCSPCNPCTAGGGSPKLNPCEAKKAYNCAQDAMKAAYDKAGLSGLGDYQDWEIFNTAPYQSATHGNRYVNNYVDAKGADAYGAFEDIDEMPAGAVLAKDSFSVSGNGKIGVGPLFLMEKMESGFNSQTDDWKYTMIQPSGEILGVTNGQGSQNVQFCADCHVAVAGNQDSLYFVPQEVRKD